jgi:ankyrin repeat protein
LLVAHNADVNARDVYGCTPLFRASIGHAERSWMLTGVMVLLLAHDADINAKNNAGYTPYQTAVNSRDKDMAKWLLSHGAHK